MPSSSEQSEAFVYRRVSPADRAKAPRRVKPQLFTLRPMETGLSVFAAWQVSPRQTLQALLDYYRALADAEGEAGAFAQERLAKYPDVETLLRKDWGVLKIPVRVFLERGFALSEPEPNGHLNILGSEEQFLSQQADFPELVVEGVIRLLSEEECLSDE